MKRNLLTLMLGLSLTLGSCSKGSKPEAQNDPDISVPQKPAQPASINKTDYPVFPNADAGADPSVPAEQGGKGFDGKGWETNTDFDFIGDPRALKGGMLRDNVVDFPGTLRMEGPESNSAFNYSVTTMAYESLLSLHPTTQE